MSCNYCDADNPKVLLEGKGWCVLVCYDHASDEWVLEHEELMPPFGEVRQTKVDVKHCPICGRKLGIEVDG